MEYSVNLKTSKLWILNHHPRQVPPHLLMATTVALTWIWLYRCTSASNSA